MMTKALDILLVEDNSADARLIREALREGRVASTLSVVHDGVEALAYLRREDPYAHTRRPDLVLLDLNLPMKSGHEVLTELKNDPQLWRIPVVVLSAHHEQEVVRATYDLHANCYIAKPADPDLFASVGRSINSFWHTVAQLPAY